MYRMTVHSKFLHTPIYNKTLSCDTRTEANVLALAVLKRIMGSQSVTRNKLSTRKAMFFVRGQFAGELILTRL